MAQVDLGYKNNDLSKHSTLVFHSNINCANDKTHSVASSSKGVYRPIQSDQQEFVVW